MHANFWKDTAFVLHLKRIFWEKLQQLRAPLFMYQGSTAKPRFDVKKHGRSRLTIFSLIINGSPKLILLQIVAEKLHDAWRKNCPELREVTRRQVHRIDMCAQLENSRCFRLHQSSWILRPRRRGATKFESAMRFVLDLPTCFLGGRYYLLILDIVRTTRRSIKWSNEWSII